MRYRKEVFLFSAAHALAILKEKQLWTIVGEVLVPISGPFECGFKGTSGLGNHFTDSVDAAVIQLPKQIADDIDAFALDDGPPPAGPATAYYLTAFPAHRTDVDTQEEEGWRTPIARLLAEADDGVYAEEKCDRGTHIVFRRQSMEQLDGASGGPIGELTLHGTSETPEVRLAAIFIEANAEVAVGARIHLHMELARDIVARKTQQSG